MTDLAEIYAKLHKDRFLHIEERRRARNYQAELEKERENVDCLAREICNLYSDLENAVSEKRQYQAKLAEIERIIDEYVHRYSEGSQGRVAIESVSLKINGG